MPTFQEKFKPFNKPWTTKHFKSSEFDSPDVPGSGSNMSSVFIEILEKIRSEVMYTFQIDSGFRTVKHNNNIGGKSNSSHLRGLAVDIFCVSDHIRFLIIQSAIKNGVKRIGIGNNFIHLDFDDSLPQEVVFLY